MSKEYTGTLSLELRVHVTSLNEIRVYSKDKYNWTKCLGMGWVVDDPDRGGWRFVWHEKHTFGYPRTGPRDIPPSEVQFMCGEIQDKVTEILKRENVIPPSSLEEAVRLQGEQP